MACSLVADTYSVFLHHQDKLLCACVTILSSWKSAHRASHSEKSVAKPLVLPRRKQRSPLSVLEKLSGTVGTDPTSHERLFLDDPYLLPRTSDSQRRFLASHTLGKQAAQWFVQHDSEPFADYRPTSESEAKAFEIKLSDPGISEIGDDGILERIRLCKVSSAYEMYENAVTTGIALKSETIEKLLEILCVYNGKDLDTSHMVAKVPWIGLGGDETRTDKFQRRVIENKWDGSLSEKLFFSIPDPSPVAWSHIILGMVKHGSFARARELYWKAIKEMNLSLPLPTHNCVLKSLVLDSSLVSFDERWDIAQKILQSIAQSDLAPDLHTFYPLLDMVVFSGRRNHHRVFQIISEMAYCNCEPSLGLYFYLCQVYKNNSETFSSLMNSILDDLGSASFSLRHPTDCRFFSTAMYFATQHGDLNLAYRIDDLLNVPGNRRLLGDIQAQKTYYLRFLKLVISIESVDAFMAVYSQIVPAKVLLTASLLEQLVTALSDQAGYRYLPQIWADFAGVQIFLRSDIESKYFLALASSLETDIEPSLKEQFHQIVLKRIEMLFQKPSRAFSERLGQSGGGSAYPLTAETAGYIMELFVFFDDIRAVKKLLKYCVANKDTLDGEYSAKSIEILKSALYARRDQQGLKDLSEIQFNVEQNQKHVQVYAVAHGPRRNDRRPSRSGAEIMNELDLHV